MFRLMEPLSGQIQNIVPVYPVSAQYGIPYCALTECTSAMFLFGLMMARWAETCRRIFNIDYQYVFCLLTE
jgi:hypothetical protein